MSQEASAEEGFGTVDTMLSPPRCSDACQNEGKASFVSWLIPHQPGASWGTGVWTDTRKGGLEEDAQLVTCSQAAACRSEAQSHLMQATGLSQYLEPSPEATQPVSAEGRVEVRRGLHISLTDVLARRQPTICYSVCQDLPEGAGVLPKASSPRPGEMEEGERGTVECNGTSPSFSKEGSSKSHLPCSPGLLPTRAQKKLKCQTSGEGKEEACGFLWLSGDTPQSADMESPGAQCAPLSPRNPEYGPGDLGGSWLEWTLGADVEGCFPSGEDGALPQSPCDRPGSPLTEGSEAQGAAGERPSQSLDLCLGESGKTSMGIRESEVWAGADESCVASHDLEQLEDEAQPVCWGQPRQCLSPPNTSANCPKIAISKAPSGPVTGQRQSLSAKTLKRRPEVYAQDEGTEKSSDNSSTVQPEKHCPKVCLQLEEMKMFCGVKRVCYVAEGPVIRLLGTLGQAQAGKPQSLQLEPLEDMMEISAASPAQRLRRRGQCLAQWTPTGQNHLQEAEEEMPSEQAREEYAGQPSLDTGVRDTVVCAMQKVLWTRLQEHPSLALSWEAVESIAKSIEAALFALTQVTNSHYKNKYRSLLFNLQDPRNPELLLKVLQGSVKPHDLVRMNSIQLASEDLARWRDQEEKRGLALLEQQQQEPYSLPAFKVTHKGEVEILRDTEQSLMLEYLVPALPEGLTEQHMPHFPDPNCQNTCTDGRETQQGPHPTSEPQDSSTVPDRIEDNIFQNILSSVPMCSPKMSPNGQKSPVEPQDRPQMPNGPAETPSSQPPWEGAVDMFSIKRFRAKAQLVSGHSCRLVTALPEVIRSAGCIPSNTVWDLLASVCPADAKDVCVVRLCPHSSRDVQNCRLLYSYLNNKQRHCLGAVEDMGLVLLPLPAFQPLPARLRPLGGPGLDITHSSLLLAVLLPKAKLKDPTKPCPLKGKARKMVSFNRKVELRCYQPETRKSAVASKGLSGSRLRWDRSLTPRGLCSWQRPPRGRGRLWGEPETEKHPEQRLCPQEQGWSQSWHPHLAAPTDAGQKHSQHIPGASCPRQALLQYLESLVTMSQQLQASLRSSDQKSVPPSFATSSPLTTVPEILGLLNQTPTVPAPPGLTTDSSLDSAEGAGL